jgi:hypothetical protein
MPAEQLAQAAAPAAEYRPWAQLEHASDELAPVAAEYRPALQRAQLVVPVFDW